MTMPSTIGDLIPQDPGDGGLGGDVMVPQGPKMGDLLAAAPAQVAPQGGVIRAGEVPSAGDDLPKKAETLSDLRALFPQLQDSSSGYRILVERTHPKVRAGMKVAGVLGSFTSYHDGNDLLSTEGFEAQFGWGTYVVWVEGPSKNSIDPTTGHPRIIRKGEIKHDVPERPMQQNPLFTPQFVVPHPANSQVELERARAEGRVMDKLAERALTSLDPRQPVDNGVGSIAAAAVQANSEQARAIIENLSRQNASLQAQINDLMFRAGQPQSSTSDSIVQTVLARGNADVDAMRSSYERQIEQIRQANDDRIERMRQDYDRTIERMRQDFQQREDNIRAQMEKMSYSDKTLFEDRFRHEREHLTGQINSMRADHERALASARDEYARNLQSLKESRDRDLEVIQGNQRLIIESKETEISRLREENARLQDKVSSLDSKVNMPFHERLREIQLHAQLVGIGSGGESEEPKEEKKDMVEKAMEFAQTPVGQMMAAAALKKAGLLPDGPPAPPMMTQGGPPQQQQQRRQRGPQQKPPQQQNPQQQPAQQAAPQQQPPPPSQKQPDGPKHSIELLGGEQPLPEADMRTLMPQIEEHFFGARSQNQNPAEVANQLHMVSEMQKPGVRVTKKLIHWIDAFNFCKILDIVSQGKHGWMDSNAVSWVKEVWEVLAKINEAMDSAPPQDQQPQPPAAS